MLKKNSRFLTTSLITIISLMFLFPSSTYARTNITDWYIKQLSTRIEVNKDSSLNITEDITADCGNLPDKHGIFRTLPTQIYYSKGESINTPIKLISITNFNNEPVKYTATDDRLNHTLTWKIGDPNVTVTGENYYRIKYQVKNAIRFQNENFDEFYWNLLGTFWQLEIDKFNAEVVFPLEINSNNTNISYYSGSFGDKSAELAKYSWSGNNILSVESIQTILPGGGITFSVTTPKNIFTPYKPSFFEKYGKYLFLIFPFLAFSLCYLLWSKYGRDPKINPTIAPEFAIPENLPPMELAMVLNDGILASDKISAGIVNLAVKGAIQIEKVEKKGIFGKEDYRLKIIKSDVATLTSSEKLLIEKLFDGKNEILTSNLENKFYAKISEIKKFISKDLAAKKWLIPRSRILQIVFIVISVVVFFFMFIFMVLSPFGAFCIFLSALIIFIFSFLMRQSTPEEALLVRKIKGFRLYMETAEKYRQQFNEKENIFEKFLPYAMVFGLTKLWIEKMKMIYGQDYFTSYHPIWFVGPSFSAFNADSFASSITSLSSNMSSTLSSSPSSSGSGGGGFSGGGGGGGGGGGW